MAPSLINEIETGDILNQIYAQLLGGEGIYLKLMQGERELFEELTKQNNTLRVKGLAKLKRGDCIRALGAQEAYAESILDLSITSINYAFREAFSIELPEVLGDLYARLFELKCDEDPSWKKQVSDIVEYFDICDPQIEIGRLVLSRIPELPSKQLLWSLDVSADQLPEGLWKRLPLLRTEEEITIKVDSSIRELIRQVAKKKR